MSLFWVLYVSLIIGMIWQLFDLPSPPDEALENSQILPSQSGGEGRVRSYRMVTDYFAGD